MDITVQYFNDSCFFINSKWKDSSFNCEESTYRNGVKKIVNIIKYFTIKYVVEKTFDKNIRVLDRLYGN